MYEDKNYTVKYETDLDREEKNFVGEFVYEVQVDGKKVYKGTNSKKASDEYFKVAHSNADEYDVKMLMHKTKTEVVNMEVKKQR